MVSEAAKAEVISKTARARANAQMRRQQVLELRLGGNSFRAISDRLGIAVSTVHKDYRKALVSLVDQETVDQSRAMQTERYQRLLLSHWPRAIGYTDDENVKHPPSTKSADTCLKIIQQIRAMNGLDAPVKTELTGKDGEPLQFQTVAEAIKAAAESERAGHY